MARILRGTISSNKMDKTVVVTVDRVKEHPLYRKKYSASTKFKAHDEDNSCKMGDVVEISETRPVSRDKRWIVTRVISSSEVTS
ncbi:MAG TPA: 30S ribosomal protein S17 [Candidatus Polarisedimenticolaceae bacterium]|nr:30S ribosomal protein S17 [Candidatus Polarisedimenticolaceae bacterium]